MSKVKAIIPCCGFGTRMSMEINSSKELLINPITQKPLIEWHLELCNKYNITPHILLRKEKQDLIDYCIKNSIEYLIMDPGKEWQETIYNSRDVWEDFNIVLFPDSIFEPKYSLYLLKDAFDRNQDFSFGAFEVKDPSKWLCTTEDGIFEKQKVDKDFVAIGLIGFKKEPGERLFKSLSETSMYFFNNESRWYCLLENYKDLTRTGKIE